jgi:hypothetical protein
MPANWNIEGEIYGYFSLKTTYSVIKKLVFAFPLNPSTGTSAIVS